MQTLTTVMIEKLADVNVDTVEWQNKLISSQQLKDNHFCLNV